MHFIENVWLGASIFGICICMEEIIEFWWKPLIPVYICSHEKFKSGSITTTNCMEIWSSHQIHLQIQILDALTTNQTSHIEKSLFNSN